MSRTDFDDETLMRFADGDLPAGEAAAIERAMAEDDALLRRVGIFIETRSAAKIAIEPLLSGPIPAPILDRIAELTRGPLPRVEPAPSRAVGASWPVLAMAASVALVVGGLAGYWLTGSHNPGVTGIAGLDSPSLAAALGTTRTGATTDLSGGARLRAIATFRRAGEAICREFEVSAADRQTVIAVACRSDGRWRVSFAVAATAADNAFAPASASEALDAYLRAIGAEPPMGSADEAAALAE